jgi:two-component sensor histidine kinase
MALIQFVALLIVILLASLIFIILLRDQVAKKTEKLSTALKERETLLRELYHRTKNTLQVIQSMLSLQAAEYGGDSRVASLVEITRERIFAISLVHQKLYQSKDLSSLEIGGYLRDLITQLINAYEGGGRRITLDIKIPERQYLIDTIVPLGLVCNELVTNSLKYAFPDKAAGTIRLEIRAGDGQRDTLYYADDGIGLPPSFDISKTTTLGFQLIQNLIQSQLGGTLEIDGSKGFALRAEYSTYQYAQRV